MGASSSKDTELDEALSKFSEEERQKLDKLFDSLSSGTCLDKAAFKQHASQCFPETFCEKIFNAMSKSHKKQESQGQVNKRDFLINVSQIVKGSLNKKIQVFYFLATTNEKATLEDISALSQVLIECYVKAVGMSSSGATHMNAGSNTEANKRLTEMLLKTIPEEKLKSGGVAESDLEGWMIKEVLLMRLFEEAFRACFFGPDSILDTHSHGLEEGCEPTVEHVPKRKDILLPCKIDFQGHNIETMLDVPSMLMLNHAIPSDCRHIWRLLYATSCHGKSFTTFLHRIVYQGPTILLIKDRDGAIFGGFASTSWKVKSCFTGNSDCFLFTLNPLMSIYHPTGINEHYMYLNVGMQTIPNGLGMGGQFEYFGLWLHSDFGPGHSKARPKCTTYGSPQLSGSEEFEVEDIEVWGVGVSPEQEEKQRSVLDTETDAQAILDLIGKERKSDGFREPEDSD